MYRVISTLSIVHSSHAIFLWVFFFVVVVDFFFFYKHKEYDLPVKKVLLYQTCNAYAKLSFGTARPLYDCSDIILLFP